MVVNLTEPALWSYGLALVASIAFGIHLLLGARGAPRGRLLIVAVLLGAPAAFAAIALIVSGHAFWWLAYRLADSCRVAAWLAFLATLVRPTALAEPRGRARWAVGGLGVAAMLFLAVYLPATAPFSNAPPVIGRGAFGGFLAATIVGLVLVEALVRNATDNARWQLKPLMLGVGGALAFDLFLYADALLFGALDPTLWAARGLIQVLVLPFLAVATVRNREWTIDIAVSRGVVFHSTALLVAGLYLLVMAAAGYYVQFFGGGWGRLLQVALVFGALLFFVFMVGSSAARARLRVFISKNFFSYRYDYRHEWLRVTNLLATRDDAARLNERVVAALANLVESPGGSLWLKREPGGGYRQVAQGDMRSVAEPEPADGALVRFLERRAWVIELDELRSQPALYEGLTIPAWLAATPSAWLVVPLIAVDDLVGFVVLSRSLTPVEVNWEVRDLLKSAGRQAASYLAQIQAAEALLEASKFDAFNRMSAFVVHDLKNLAAQLTLLLKNAERHKDNREFQADMLDTVRHVTERVNGLLSQLRAGTAPVANPAPVDLGAVVRRVESLRVAKTPQVVVETPAPVFALGHDDRLERVISHIVQNAQDATRDGSPVRVNVGAERDFAVVEVVDRGIGMSAEFVRERLFKPFQTTKTSGMGIGAYESAQYVRELGGRIEVDSAEGAGTRVRVLLPRAGVREPGASVAAAA